ncbi:hypothetical protein LU276_03875 [Moraxella haemolytica]|uniref:hypothetical protein n=1 Tax=Moraxella haemolytica TaxID=2904119 RepID=UPI0025438133|nr:hypothetical protein [Moraxella sp. ZY171148]WII95961.1 hypothetical protein LU276_03875 [Moraxella sp. ZY171148]
MHKAKKTVLIPKKERLLDAKTYLAEIQCRQDIIDDVQFIPPKLGSKGFGSFRVSYSTPVLLPEGV